MRNAFRWLDRFLASLQACFALARFTGCRASVHSCTRWQMPASESLRSESFSPLLFVHLIERYQVSLLLTSPSHVAMLVQSPVLKLADLSSVRIYLVGGGFLAQHLRRTLQDHLLYGTLIVTYGMTEIGGVAATTLPFQKASNSVGKITPNTRMKVRKFIWKPSQVRLLGNFSDC